ncbi:hypothetical protein TRICI_002389 [Trichomonascus ciferrii]|uniref:Major facilitator superfamily (MFS) profile domain-containing protein n=1 Tax=Trichomonascus ciferrii TaxID=44093 RepID=A0A642V608_9ASCO|nr:hypothetical protein TRICI_002389 [Trichomonascus ciferrii]
MDEQLLGDYEQHGEVPEEEVVRTVDKKSLEYVTFLVIGLSYLWPWNCFLAATAYFTGRLAENEYLKTHLSSYIMSVSTITGTIASLILADRQRGANYAGRVFSGEVMICATFILMALSCIFGNVGTVSYFLFVMLCVWGSTVGTAFAQNGSFAVVNTIDSVYTQAIMVGQAVAGVLPPLINFLSTLLARKVSNDDATAGGSGMSAAMYFLVASVVSGVAFSLFMLIKRRHGELLHTHSEQTAVKTHIPLSVLLKKLRSPAFAVFFTFAVTLVYPVFISNIDSANGIRYELFVPLSFLVWNLGDLGGRVLCGYEQYVVKSSHRFVFYAILRLSFIPAYLLCNVHGSGWIKSDFIYFLIHFTFGVTNGHLGSSGMMSPPDYVDEHEKAAAGGFMTLVLSLGLAAGALSSFILVSILS